MATRGAGAARGAAIDRSGGDPVGTGWVKSLALPASIARPLSVSVYAPLSRLCAMNLPTAMDCIARARMPTATWSMPVAAQNRITRSCASSFVVGLAIA
jgi:hypothetical protein